jgi:hypothetical protein
MQGKPLRILLSARAMEFCGDRVRGVLGDRPAELLASETAGPTPDADIGFVTRDVIGASGSLRRTSSGCR